MNPYDHKEIEKKWQDVWETEQSFAVKEDAKKKKSYFLVEFPYPSGAGLHVGHPRSYTAMDVLARKRRMEGENVLYPIGFDAFGLPTENYAIKTGRPPAEITKENCDNFRRQLKALGFSFDWTREVNTTDPEYYKWTQWIFLKMYEQGLAYKAKSTINWCPSCKIGLAHEEVVNGKCERCGSDVVQREKEQWMLRITKYADRLIDDLETVDYLPRIKNQQINWIGRSEGAQFGFKLRGVTGQEDDKHEVRVFTTRLDTIYGATFIVVSPETAKFWMNIGWQANDAVKSYVEESLKKRELDRMEQKDKTGVDTGVRAVHPLTGEELPVWVADYVLGSYGTGSIMAVPAHDERDFEFAKKFGLDIKQVVLTTGSVAGSVNESGAGVVQEFADEWNNHYTNYGKLINSSEFDGMTSEDVIPAIAKKIGAEIKNQYKLRDWVFSRQRYWGEPIPMIKCDRCDWVAVPEDQLPVTLPEVEKYEPTDTGESPLSAIRDWVETTCPKCGGKAERETDTMPNWAGSSWYFLRYADTHNETALASGEKLNYWTPVDWYNGGMEHTTLHLLYSRFWHKFLFDIGVVPTAEPYLKRTSHGMILAEDGTKMSKSKGNVVNPDEIVATFGADTLRTYEMFMGPFADTIAWSTDSLVGVRRFLDRVYYIVKEVTTADAIAGDEKQEKELRFMVAKTVKKIGEDVETFNLNTAVSSMMELVNHLYQIRNVDIEKQDALQKLLLVLQPFAPHLTAELWSAVGGEGYVWKQGWPTYDEADLVRDIVTIAVQVNGKLRGTIEAENNIGEAEAIQLAKKNDNVSKWLAEKELVKQIYVPGKLINFVIKE
jgi:leucyl-tRNA synthetase